MYVLVSDGGSKGNPGPSACAFGLYLTDNEKWIFRKSIYLGLGTNNTAEYHGLIYGLLSVWTSNLDKLVVLSDSELMINQIKGTYACSSQNLIPLLNQVNQIILNTTIKIKFQHYPRSHHLIKDIDTEYNICMKLNK